MLQKWQQFGKFSPEHSKVWNICTLISPFWANYITFDRKKYRRVVFRGGAIFRIFAKTSIGHAWLGSKYTSDILKTTPWKTQLKFVSCPNNPLTNTGWKVSVFGVFVVRIFLHLVWLRIWKTQKTNTFHAV